MNKTWLTKLASIIEERHGKEARDKIFGDINSVGSGQKSRAEWFDRFTSGMDELNDKEFLSAMMADNCPCGGNAAKEGKVIKETYDKSKTLDEFVYSLDKWYHSLWKGREDIMELRGNVLYMTKRPMNNKKAGKCGAGCHCTLAKQTDKYVSDIFVIAAQLDIQAGPLRQPLARI